MKGASAVCNFLIPWKSQNDHPVVTTVCRLCSSDFSRQRDYLVYAPPMAEHIGCKRPCVHINGYVMHIVCEMGIGNHIEIIV